MITPRVAADLATIHIDRGEDGRYVLKTRMEIAFDIEETFRFFADAENLDSITPPWLQFKIVTMSPIQMGEGTRIKYRLRIHKLPVGWTSEIRDWNPPYSFVDSQVAGPYREWNHLHRLSSMPGGGTLVEDVVHYRPPFGRLANRLFVQRDLERIFAYRSRMLPAAISAALGSGL